MLSPRNPSATPPDTAGPAVPWVRQAELGEPAGAFAALFSFQYWLQPDLSCLTTVSPSLSLGLETACFCLPSSSGCRSSVGATASSGALCELGEGEEKVPGPMALFFCLTMAATRQPQPHLWTPSCCSPPAFPSPPWHWPQPSTYGPLQAGLLPEPVCSSGIRSLSKDSQWALGHVCSTHLCSSSFPSRFILICPPSDFLMSTAQPCWCVQQRILSWIIAVQFVATSRGRDQGNSCCLLLKAFL